MTKAIKFNLMLDKHPVRDLDDLRENFNLDDLLPAFHSKLLQRWLKVRGLNHELAQLEAIKTDDEQKIAIAICKLFQANLGDDEIKTAVYPFIFRQQQEQQLKTHAEQQFKREAVIKEYHTGYEKLCADMLSHAQDYPFLKTAVNILWTDYAQLFSVDFVPFFYNFIDKSPLTLFTILANNDYRLPKLFTKKRKEQVFSHIPIDVLISPYKSYAGITNGYWKDLEPKGTKCLILSMEEGNFVRNTDNKLEELNAVAINKKFLILDGLCYKSNNANHALIYMVI